MIGDVTVHWLHLSKLNGVNELSLFPEGYKVVSPPATDPVIHRTMASNAQLPMLAQPEEPPVDFAVQPSALGSVLLHHHVLPKSQWKLSRVQALNCCISDFQSLEPCIGHPGG